MCSEKKAVKFFVMYRTFIANKLAGGEKASSLIGNMYTASIFMSLISLLCDALNSDNDLEGKTIGFIAYGSGSKSKVFQGVVEANWKEKVENIQLFQYLESRTTIDINTYEQLHRNELFRPVTNGAKITISHVENGETNKGLRRYILN